VAESATADHIAAALIAKIYPITMGYYKLSFELILIYLFD